MSRKDHLYTSLDKNLCKVVDVCASNIFRNGAQVYKTRREFITQAIQYHIEYEKKRNTKLAEIIENQLATTTKPIVIENISSSKSSSKLRGNRKS
jgi:hypothetical protein